MSAEVQLVSKRDIYQQMEKELLNQVGFLALHLFIASWQYSLFTQIKQHMPADDWTVLVADFAENYQTFYQDEIQSAHWQCQ